jgi:hypothetical protein
VKSTVPTRPRYFSKRRCLRTRTSRALGLGAGRRHRGSACRAFSTSGMGDQVVEEVGAADGVDVLVRLGVELGVDLAPDQRIRQLIPCAAVEAELLPMVAAEVAHRLRTVAQALGKIRRPKICQQPLPGPHPHQTGGRALPRPLRLSIASELRSRIGSSGALVGNHSCGYPGPGICPCR